MSQLWEDARAKFHKRLARANAEYEKYLAKGLRQRKRPSLRALAEKHGVAPESLRTYRSKLKREQQGAANGETDTSKENVLAS